MISLSDIGCKKAASKAAALVGNEKNASDKIFPKKPMGEIITKELMHKPIKRKFRERPVIVVGIADTWSADLVDMTSFAKFNKGIKYLLTIIGIFSKYAWAVPVRDKTGASVTKAFEKVMINSK